MDATSLDNVQGGAALAGDMVFNGFFPWNQVVPPSSKWGGFNGFTMVSPMVLW